MSCPPARAGLRPGLALAACAGPIGTTRVAPQVVQADLGRSAITTGEPSWPTRNVLFERGLFDAFTAEPEAALADLHRAMVAAQAEPHLLFALAELSFLHGQARRSSPPTPWRPPSTPTPFCSPRTTRSLEPASLARGGRGSDRSTAVGTTVRRSSESGASVPRSGRNVPAGGNPSREGHGGFRHHSDLITYPLEVSPLEKTRRLEARINDRCKAWKSPAHGPGILNSCRFEHPQARDEKDLPSPTQNSPPGRWRSRTKRDTRASISSHICSDTLPSKEAPREKVTLPKRQKGKRLPGKRFIGSNSLPRGLWRCRRCRWGVLSGSTDFMGPRSYSRLGADLCNISRAWAAIAAWRGPGAKAHAVQPGGGGGKTPDISGVAF